LQFAHPGEASDDGTISLLPHVAVLDRNVVFRSADPNGTRGHVLLAGRADINIRYARFEDLGRTSALVPVDNTVVDASGVVTHFGTNQIGRYAMHLHHVIGPANATNTGYQFKLIGNTFDNGRRWGVALHSTSFGLLQDNITYKFQGAGFATVDGSEIENLFTHNFAARIQGTNSEQTNYDNLSDVGRSGSGYWMRKAGNILRNNVATDVSFAGLVINGHSSTQEHLPAFRGANDDIEGEYVFPDHNPPGWIDGFEAYGRTKNGIWMIFPTGKSEDESNLTFRGITIWHTHGNGIETYHINRVTFDDVTILGQKSAMGSARTGISRWTIGIQLITYEVINLVIRHAHIENEHIGITSPELAGGSLHTGEVGDPTRIEQSYLQNLVNLRVSNNKWSEHDLRGKALVVSDTMFLTMSTAGMLYVPSNPANIQMWYRAPKRTDGRDLMSSDVVTIYNYNRVPGDSFRLYYNEQQRDFVPPATIYGIGSPVPGLTNGQLWSLFGIAVGGALAPENATTREGIIGLIGPASTAGSSRPTVEATATLADEKLKAVAIDVALSGTLSAKRKS
jgi:hypothetical protein